MPGKRPRCPLRAPWLAAVLCCVLIPPAAAEDRVRFALPIDCTPGETCWIVNYVDRDPSPAEADYACGKATYDGHKGVDFAVRDKTVMRLGVPVLAAADGEVVGLRDGMPDVNYRTNGGAESVKGRECGNGVAIQHANGLRTQYCHMLRNTVRVDKGQKVKVGDKLGFVGHSGKTEFPHLHFQVMRGKEIIDPFLGPDPGDAGACGVASGHLWGEGALEAMPYRPTAIYNVGFSARAPKTAGVRDGLYQDTVLSRRAPALIFWTDIFRVRKGDTLTMVLRGPGGEEIARHANVLEKNQARRFVFVGRKRKGLFWPEGVYRGEVVLSRGEAEKFSTVKEVTLR